MGRSIYSFFRYYWFLLVILIGSAAPVSASHIVGMDLKYSHISGNTYNIICVAYGDCGPSSHSAFTTLSTATPGITIYDGDTYVGCISLSIEAPSAGINIAKYVICAIDSDSTTCNNPSSSTPGITKFVYSGTYTFPHNSHFWRLIYSGNMGTSSAAGRAAAITNINGGTTTQLEDTLDNFTYSNSNPNLSLEPILFFCIGNHDTYNPVAVDPDGDSLRFELIAGTNGNGLTCNSVGPGPYGQVIYNPGYSPTSPLSATPGSFSFDPVSGQIDFIPSGYQRSMVVYNIREFRGGTFVGSSQREMNFIAVPCTNTTPAATIAHGTNGFISPDSVHFFVCSTAGAFSFDIKAHESDTSKKIYVTAVGLPTGASLNIVNDSTNAPVITISWNTTGLTPGVYTFYLKFQDNNCPVNGVSIKAFTIKVSSPSALPGSDSVCLGGTTMLTTFVAGANWNSTNPAIAAVDSVTGLAQGINVGNAEVYFINATDGCKDSFLLKVYNPTLPIVGLTDICIGSTATYTDIVTGGIWDKRGSNISISADGVVNTIATGADTVIYKLSNGCLSYKPITVDPNPVLSVIDSGCTAGTTYLNVSPAGGTWVSNNSSVATVNYATGGITGVSPGTVVIVYTSLAGCKDSIPYNIHISVPISIGITVTPNATQCFGQPFFFSAITTNGGHAPTLQWTKNGTVIATGDTVTLTTGLNGDVIKCTMIPDTLCGLPNPDNSNPITLSVIKNTPAVKIVSTFGDSSCAGLSNTYHLVASDTGVLPNIEWSVNYIPVATNVTSYSFTPSNGDIISVSIHVDLPCAMPNPAVATDTLSVFNYKTPSLSLYAPGGNAVCYGNTMTIVPIPAWGGTKPLFYWDVNGVPYGTSPDSILTYAPLQSDSVSCIMISNFPCVVPTDTARASMVVELDSIIVVNIVGNPGAIVQIGVTDTLYAIVKNGGYNPTYQWLMNGVPIEGATNATYINSQLKNKDSLTCMVRTGGGTACEGIIGFNWMIFTVAPVGVNNLNPFEQDIQIIPNPNSGIFRITGSIETTSGSPLSIEIANVIGEKILTKNLHRVEKLDELIDMGVSAPNGIYFVSVVAGSGRVVKRFCLNR